MICILGLTFREGEGGEGETGKGVWGVWDIRLTAVYS